MNEIRIFSGLTVIGMEESASVERGAAFTYRLGGKDYPCIEVRSCHTCMNRRHRQRIEELHLAGIGIRQIHEDLPEGVDISYDSLKRHLKRHLPVEVLEEWRRRKERALEKGLDEDGYVFTEEHLLDEIQRRVYEAMVRGELTPGISHSLQVSQIRASRGQDSDTRTIKLYESAFSIYTEEARKIMPPAMWDRFCQTLLVHPVLMRLEDQIEQNHQQELAAAGETA